MLNAQRRDRITQLLAESALVDGMLCAERDLRMVREFFTDACIQFTGCILAGVEVRPMLLGNGHHQVVNSILMTCRWPRSGDPSCDDHPYHGEWMRFAKWCQDHGLKPLIENRVDRHSRESWYAINVAARDPTLDPVSLSEAREEPSG